jgi:hypothetical protein
MGSGIGKRAAEAAKTALQRIEMLETLVQVYGEDRMKLLDSLNGVNAIIENRLITLEKCINAVVEVVDKVVTAAKKQNKVVAGGANTPEGLEIVEAFRALEDVTTTLKRQLRDEMTRTMESDKAGLAAAVAAGQLAPDDVISETSLIVGREYDVNGDIRHPGWVQLLHGQAKGTLKAELIGKKAGDVLPMGKGKFEVLEVYKVIAQPTSAPATATPAATSEPEPAPAVNAELSQEEADKALAEYMATATDDSSGPADSTVN